MTRGFNITFIAVRWGWICSTPEVSQRACGPVTSIDVNSPVTARHTWRSGYWEDWVKRVKSLLRASRVVQGHATYLTGGCQNWSGMS